jgi:hypothetical protein
MEMTLVKFLHSGDPDLIPNTRTCKVSARQQTILLARLAMPQLGIKPSALLLLFGLYILVQFMCVHVCSCNTCTVGSHVVGSYVDVPNIY